MKPDGRIIERIPIVLANNQTGRVLTLVAERLPGPPRLITPHWLRLGMAPLGQEHQLAKAIRKAFLAVIGNGPETRHQFRWWLEPPRDGEGNALWPDDIPEAESVEIAAVCLAKALLERTPDSPPLLDPKALVSGALGGEAGTPLDERPVESVGHIGTKHQSAETAGMHTMVLPAANLHDAITNSPTRPQPVANVGDAYQAVLATTGRVQGFKRSSANQVFIAIEDTGTKSAKYIEVHTHPAFFVDEPDEQTPRNIPWQTDEQRQQLANDCEKRFVQAPDADPFLLRQPIWYGEVTSD
ncbi:MAG: hypothetical protein KDA71_25835, partial [Planctomycetales bacterium]|nr:hypothetical protein [Planctomycetales bacterium]